MKKDFLAISDFSRDEIMALLDDAIRLKADLRAGKMETVLSGKTLGMLFEKPSTRTRLSFEVGMMQLGGRAIYVRGEEVGLGERESVEDVARVFSRYMDCIMFRSKSHRDMEVFAEYATVPVINGLSDFNHPCQALADMLTILEHKKRLEGIKLVYVGDGNNVCESLMSACDLLGLRMTVVAPEAYFPRVVRSTSVELTSDLLEGVRGADVVYTDVWTSMGQEEEKKRRLKAFNGFCVTEQVMAIAGPKAIFMHCLPAHRGEEVSHGVMESEQSVVFDQAENRMHAQKAVLVSLM
jgi:ornithine carbamoyltransferase